MSRYRFMSKAIVSMMLSFFISDLHALTEAQQMIEKMSDSARELDYQGYFNYDRGQVSSSYQIFHKVDNGLEKQRLVFMDGKPLEIINDGHSLKCIHAGESGLKSHATGEVEPFLKMNQPIAAIWQYYNAQITGEGRIADRAVVRIHLKPKDTHRYPFVFFVDRETGLMLKMLVLDHKGRRLERFHYVAIDYGDVKASDLQPQMNNYNVVDHEKPEMIGSLSGEERWRLTWIPEGFIRETAKMKPEVGSVDVEQTFMYSDGLSAFSVFVEQSSGLGESTSTRLGGTSAISHFASIDGKSFLVTVIGEIPLMTAKQIALSVRPSQ